MMYDKYEFIEDFPGVMERLGGNEAMLGRLLCKFHDIYCNSRTQLQKLLATNEKEEAYRLVHSIKGVSGNLGIGELYRLSATLENRMKADEYDNIHLDVETFLAELDKVVGSITAG